MPYARIADLPKAQVDQYTHHPKEAFLKAFNHAYEQLICDDTKTTGRFLRRVFVSAQSNLRFAFLDRVYKNIRNRLLIGVESDISRNVLAQRHFDLYDARSFPIYPGSGPTLHQNPALR